MTTDTPVTTPHNAGTTGRISLVGIGPGHTDHMTARARAVGWRRTDVESWSAARQTVEH